MHGSCVIIIVNKVTCFSIINKSIFVMGTYNVFFEVRNDFLNIYTMGIILYKTVFLKVSLESKFGRI
jgi:hypothetical protein